MSKQIDTENTVIQQVDLDVDRRTFLKLIGLSVAALGLMSATTAPTFAQYNATWDKTFPKSDLVDHQKVFYYNRLGIMLVADLYVPKNLDRSKRHPALVVGHPFGGVKEQTSGLYAQTMAERGFITLAYDASFPIIAGEKAHSRYFSEDAYKLAAEPKELHIVPEAGHVDLYDRVNLIPWDKLQSFFGQHLA